MPKRNHENDDHDDDDDATSEKVPRMTEEELEELMEELKNESDWDDSSAEEEGSDKSDDDEEPPKSKLRVEKKKSGATPPEQPDPESDVDKKAAEPKRPKTPPLKINPKNYVPPDKGERSQPSPAYAHSDEDSDLENQPKKEFSEDRMKNNREGYRVKRPPPKQNDSVITVPPQTEKSPEDDIL
uniref:Uncharacterized protein n=1 Tax=Lygus hesperus TaxID=30085 RepID=A0A0K8TGS9_LYGHE